MKIKLKTFLTLFLASQLLASAQSVSNKKTAKTDPETNSTMNTTIEVEIWSDIVCPFCYIGKRKFELALEQFPHKEMVKVTWKSFLLSPGLKTQPEKSIHEFLAEHKGISIDDARNMNSQVTEIARQVGLEYNFDKTVVASSFNAHRFLHFAKSQGKQSQAGELLFRAYFTDGKNIDDPATLLDIAGNLALDTAALKEVLQSDIYATAVEADISEAYQHGVRGVPFFLFNKKLAVSGAQDPATFRQALDKAFKTAR